MWGKLLWVTEKTKEEVQSKSKEMTKSIKFYSILSMLFGSSCVEVGDGEKRQTKSLRKMSKIKRKLICAQRHAIEINNLVVLWVHIESARWSESTWSNNGTCLGGKKSDSTHVDSLN